MSYLHIPKFRIGDYVCIEIIKMKKYSTVNEYLRDLSPKQRKVIEDVRKVIRKTAPEAEELISYGIPAFKYHGPLVYYAAFKDHYSFFPGGKIILQVFKEELKPFKTSAGTIQFTDENRLQTNLIKKIVMYRMKQNVAENIKKPPTRSSGGLKF